MSKRLALSAVASTLIVLPFLLLQLINGTGTFPFVLFAFLWILQFAFAALLRPAVRGRHAVAAILLIAVAAMWGSVVVDQMPCFLGVPNCD